jgi:mannose-6-phosphate isomerase-like protein (cupin superfamily)
MRKLVFRARDVVGFSPRGAEEAYVSRLLIDRESVGSETMVLNHFALRAGKATAPGAHPAPYDEFYYVLSGCGMLYLGDPPEASMIEPGTYAFIPAGLVHSLRNTGDADLELLTGMPQQLVEGANNLYDERRRTWGTSWKLSEEKGEP